MLEQIDTVVAFSVVMLMLSLVVTALVQVISALSDLRGRNLASGLSNLLHQIEPELRIKLADGSTVADHIADAVVKHPAIAHAGTRAKAISQDELVRVLRDLCSEKPAAVIDPTAKSKLTDLVETEVPGGVAIWHAAEAVADELATKFPDLKNEIKATVDAAGSTVSKLEFQIGQWFDTVMNRLSDIFTRKTRAITVVISVLFVGMLQIDAGEILRQITNTPGLRARLAAMSDTALSQANKIFDNSERAMAALADVRKQNEKDTQFVSALDKEAPHLTRCVDGKNWLIENFKALPNADKLEQEFDKACQEESRRAMGNSYDQIRALQSDLEKTDLKIVPVEIDRQPVFDTCAHWWAAYGVRRHLLGTLVSLVFLSLGAPFWFNMLRQLSNLKPAIAEKIAPNN